MADDFKPINPKAITPGEHEQHVQNITQSIQAATRSERRAGAQWYRRAHRDAVHLAAGVNPHVGADRERDPDTFRPTGGPQAAGQSVRSQMRGRRQALEDFRQNRSQHAQETATRRAAGVVSALSPGMAWEHNVPAAHELMHTDIHEQYQQHGREALAGHSLNRQSGDNIDKAQRISAGSPPEKELPMGIKTGAFYENIADPGHSQRATIDSRSHDIATGQRLPWKQNRGMGTGGIKQARSEYMEHAHAEAGYRTGLMPHQAQAVSWLQDKNATLREQGTKKSTKNMLTSPTTAKKRGGKINNAK